VSSHRLRARQRKDSCDLTFLLSIHPSTSEHWHSFCTKTGEGVWMATPNEHRACIPVASFLYLRSSIRWVCVSTTSHGASRRLALRCTAKWHCARQPLSAVRDGHLRKGMRLAPRPRKQQSVLIGRPEKTHPLHFSIADESKRELRACPRRPRPELRVFAPGLFPTPAVMPDWLNPESNAGVRPQSMKAVAELGPA